MTFLLLDDHPIILEFLESLIKQTESNVEIIKTCSVEDALLILKSNQIDRVICDLQIKSGKSLVIPEFCCKNEIPYMVCSSYINKSLIDSLKSMKITGYVSKGSRTDDLLTGIRKLFASENYLCPLVKREQSIKDRSDTPRPLLSRAEIRVLKAYNTGLKTAEVANLLNLKSVSVRNHRARAMERNMCGFQELTRRFIFWDE
jgi:two-component system invasion response regulator UvrY